MILGNTPEGHNLAASDGVIQRRQPGAHKSQGKGSEDSPKLYYSHRLGQWRYWRKQMSFREMWAKELEALLPNSRQYTPEESETYSEFLNSYFEPTRASGAGLLLWLDANEAINLGTKDLSHEIHFNDGWED